MNPQEPFFPTKYGKLSYSMSIGHINDARPGDILCCDEACTAFPDVSHHWHRVVAP